MESGFAVFIIMKKYSNYNKLKRLKPLLGTYVDVTIYADASDQEIISVTESIFKAIKNIEDLMSFYKEDSEISFLNKNAYNCFVPVSKDTKYVLDESIRLSKVTRGLFDVTVASHLVQKGYLPNYGYELADCRASWEDVEIIDNNVRFKKKLQLDLGGIAKGYAVDQAMLLAPAEYDVTINAGGDIAMSHFNNKIVSIKDPAHKFVRTKDVLMKNSSVATSSYYYLDGYNKIVSPGDGNFLDSKNSVSVFAKNCITADALTKVASLLGEGANNILQTEGAEALILKEYGRSYTVGVNYENQ